MHQYNPMSLQRGSPTHRISLSELVDFLEPACHCLHVYSMPPRSTARNHHVKPSASSNNNRSSTPTLSPLFRSTSAFSSNLKSPSRADSYSRLSSGTVTPKVVDMDLRGSVQPSTPTPSRGPNRRRPRRRNDGKDNQKTTASEGETVRRGNPDGLQRQEPSSEEDEVLFELLGIPTPAKTTQIHDGSPDPRHDHPVVQVHELDDTESTPGILPISKNAVERSQRNARGGRRGGKKETTGEISDPTQADQEVDLGLEERAETPSPGNKVKRKGKKAASNPANHGAESEGEGLRKSNRGSSDPKGMKGDRRQRQIAAPETPQAYEVQPMSTLSATRPLHMPHTSSKPPTTIFHHLQSMEMAALSQSLPSVSGLAMPPQSANTKSKKKGKGKGTAEGDTADESAMWDMPEVTGPSVAEELTVCSSSSLTWVKLIFVAVATKASRLHPDAQPAKGHRWQSQSWL